MARELGVKFTLDGALGSGFKAAFRGAAGQIEGISKAIRDMEKSPTGKLGASMQAQKAKIRELGASYRTATGQLQALQARATAAGGAHGVLARQISQAEAQVTRLSGQLARANAGYRETVAQATTAAGSVRGLSTAYQQLSTSMDKARARQAKLLAMQTQQQNLRGQRADLTGQLMGAAASGMAMAAPVKLSADFEDQMAKVGAVSRATDADMKMLTETARELGRSTRYTAKEAGEGMEYLAMAGFDARETVAAMPGMLDLAAASSTDLGRSADIASDILTAFGMKATEMGKVGDILTNTFTRSNTNLTMLGDTMKYCGPVAHTLGMSLNDTATFAGLLANAGIKASQGGTVMRAALLRLAAPPKMAKDALGELAGVAGPELDELYDQIGDNGDAVSALQELGMTTKDTQGNLRPLADILEELNMRTKEMGTGDRAEVFKKVFGTEASAGMMALADQAAQTVDKYGNQIVDSLGRPTNAMRKALEEGANYTGKMTATVKRMNDTTKAQLAMLGSAWQDVGISVGNMFLPVIRETAVMLSSVANGIATFTQEFPRLSQGLAFAVGGLVAFRVAMVAGRLASVIFRSSILDLQRGLLMAGNVARVAGAGMLSLGQRFMQSAVMARIAATGIKGALIGTGIGAIVVALGMAADFLITHWEGVKTFFAELGPAIWSRLRPHVQGIVDLWDGAAQWVTETWNGITGFFGEVWAGISNGASGVADFIGSVFSGVGAFFSETFGSAVDAATWAWEGISAVWTPVAGFFGGICDGIRGVFAGLFDWLASKFEWVTSAIGWIKDAAGSIFGGVSDAMDKAKAADAKANAPAASAPAPMATGSAAPANRPASPEFKPVSRKEVLAANPEPEKKGKKKSGSKSGKKAGSGGGRSASGSSGSGTTIVKVAGDNASFSTQFIPAGGSGPSLSNAGAAMGGIARTSARILPFDAGAALKDPASVLPSMAKMAPIEVGKLNLPKAGGASSAAASLASAVNVNLNQDFRIAGQGMVDEIRRKLIAAGPEFEALVRRALGDIQSQNRRVAYAQ